MSLKISVCIPTYNRPEQVQALLTNLAAQCELPDEVVIVDASPDEQTTVVVDRHRTIFPDIVYESSPKGLTLQRNRAIDLATGDILVFLDDDIILEPSFLSETRRIFTEDTEDIIAGLTGIQLNHQPRQPGAGWRLKRRLGIVETDDPGCLLACGETTPLPRPLSGQLLRTDYLPGGLTAWRKKVFNEFRFSLFFQGYGLGEDKYFSGCVSRKYQLFVSGDLKAHHFHVPGNRPNYFRLGYFNVYNHCFVMRECCRGRIKTIRFFLFHLIDVANELLSWPFRRTVMRTLKYGMGRLIGLLHCLFVPPHMGNDDPAQRNRQSCKLHDGHS